MLRLIYYSIWRKRERGIDIISTIIAVGFEYVVGMEHVGSAGGREGGGMVAVSVNRDRGMV